MGLKVKENYKVGYTVINNSGVDKHASHIEEVKPELYEVQNPEWFRDYTKPIGDGDCGEYDYEVSNLLLHQSGCVGAEYHAWLDANSSLVYFNVVKDMNDNYYAVAYKEDIACWAIEIEDPHYTKTQADDERNV